MPSWPLTIPQKPLINGYRETAPKTTIRTEMDVGPAKVRQRTTAGIRVLKLTFAMKTAEIAILDDFFLTTVKGGSLPFDFPHPRTGATLSCRFIEEPEYRNRGADNWLVGFDVEVIPS